jgi:transcriptional regulator with XRE-family HTH domain
VEDATELGKKIRELIPKNNLNQDKLAKELGVSPSALSGYITGKLLPNMEFLDKCVKIFCLEKEALSDFFYAAFMSTAKHNQEIKIDTRFIDQDRFEVLAKILTALVLFPTPPNKYFIGYQESLEEKINHFFEKYKTDARVCQAPKTDSTPSTADTK